MKTYSYHIEYLPNWKSFLVVINDKYLQTNSTKRWILKDDLTEATFFNTYDEAIEAILKVEDLNGNNTQKFSFEKRTEEEIEKLENEVNQINPKKISKYKLFPFKISDKSFIHETMEKRFNDKTVWFIAHEIFNLGMIFRQKQLDNIHFEGTGNDYLNKYLSENYGIKG